MDKTLMPIFKLRELCLETLNPDFYKKNEETIHCASMAAQEYLQSGAAREYMAHMGRNFHDLPGYVAIHKKYNLEEKINPNLIMDLTWSFRMDNLNGIISINGEIKNMAQLPKSRIMGVYHNSDISGIPSNAFKLYPEKINRLIAQATQKTK